MVRSGSPVQSRPTAPRLDFQTKHRLFGGRLAEPPPGFVGGNPLPRPARRRPPPGGRRGGGTPSAGLYLICPTKRIFAIMRSYSTGRLLILMAVLVSLSNRVEYN